MSSNPHDALFKTVFGRPEHARGALCSVLPAAVVEALDWQSLTSCDGNLIDSALSGQHTDLLFSVRWRSPVEPPLYLLFEHQSSPDDQMGFRLLRYLVRIWERWLNEHPRTKVFPVIVPIVLYHDDEPWSVPVAFDDLFNILDAVRPKLAPHLVTFTYLVDDLLQIPDEVLRSRPMTALGKLVEACFKHARTQVDLLTRLGYWADEMREVASGPQGRAALAVVMEYILRVNRHVSSEALQAFAERVGGSNAKEAVMTAGQRLIEQGIEQGVKRGIEQGERALLLRLLQRRFGNVDAGTERRVATASTEQIDAWVERALSAATLDDLLDD